MNPDHCEGFQVKRRLGKTFLNIRIAAAESRCPRTLTREPGVASNAQLPDSFICKEVHQV